MHSPIFIVGLQKSGTSLLKKILASSDHITNLFEAEGNTFWGNTPPFSPTDSPVGRVYQHHNGRQGHTIHIEDMLPGDKMLLNERLIKHLQNTEPKLYWLNKNPYLTVRLHWLKAMFPNSHVIACVRKPLPNVYSLLKRYLHPIHGRKPENGWWGVKPENWEKLIHEDPLITASNQWAEVNKKLFEDKKLVDLFVPYHQMTLHPQSVISQLESILGLSIDFPTAGINCCDNEFLDGGSIISKNQSKQVDQINEVMPPFSESQLMTVNEICLPTWSQLEKDLQCLH